MPTQIVRLNGHDLTIEQVVAVAKGHAQVELDDEAFALVRARRDGLEECIARSDVMYGVNTGCGSRKSEVMTPEWLAYYQARYIPAHCCGTGDPLPVPVVRAVKLIRLNSFMRGNSGVQPGLCELLRDCLNLGLTPYVPEYGSVGASGDLVPLAHTMAALMGLPQAAFYVDGQIVPAAEALAKFNLKPWVLGAKEAMAFTNGANFIAAIGCLAVKRAANIFDLANLAGALSLEAIRGEMTAFHKLIHEARPLPGQLEVAEMIRVLTHGSNRTTDAARKVDFEHEDVKRDQHGEKLSRVQDAYSFRCMPQIHASAYHAIEHVRKLLEFEINSSSDNPLIFPQGDTFKTYSGGNFHGQPLATLIEYLGIALAPLAGVSDRRMFALLSSKSSYGLPDDLAGPTPGNTGLMIAQYAGAALVNEIAHLSNPSSVHSVPTSANQEDWVSMGMNSALHLWRMLPLIERVLATELLGAAQGIMLTEDLLPEGLRELGVGTGVAYGMISAVWYHTEKPLQTKNEWFLDRHVSEAVQAVVDLIDNDVLLTTVWRALPDSEPDDS